MATINKYKTIAITDVSDRSPIALTSDESTKATTILTNFFTYFKEEHS